jgi:hypothetical protein
MGNNPFLKQLLKKMSAKARRDHYAEAIVVERPRGMLAARATAEVLPRQQDAGALVARLVQHELRVQRPRTAVGIRHALIEVAQRVEQVRAEAAATDRLQELLRNDQVGIDVGAIEWRDDPGGW